MTREDWQNAYEPVPAALEIRVESVLRRLPEKQTAAKRPLRTAVLVMAIVLALGGVAYAVYESITANLFGWFYGGDWKNEMQSGDIAQGGQSYRVDDVTYTIEEFVYKTVGEQPGLYGVVRVAPAEGANIVLLPEDISVDDPAGFLLHYAQTDQTIEDSDPSYAELAAQAGAKLITARVNVNAVLVDGVDHLGGCYGESWLPQKDGTALCIIEMTDGVPRADSYALALQLSCWEVTQDGQWLRDEKDGTWQKAEWNVTVTPEMKEE